LMILSLLVSTKKNFFHSRNGCQFGRNILWGWGLAALGMQCWMCSMSNLMSVLSNHFAEWFRYGWSWSPDLDPCSYFLWGFLKDTVYRNIPHTHTWRTERINFSISDHWHWRNSSCRCVKYPALASDADRCTRWKCVYVIFRLPSLLNSRDTKYSDICFIVR
jgi:hypothetical protein